MHAADSLRFDEFSERLMNLLLLGVFLVLLALILLWQSGRAERAAGLPGGRIIYTDTRSWGDKVEKSLYDPVLGLTGKPDYLVEKNGQYIPVEVKSGRAPQAPYDSHIYQLASYCLLVDKTMGSRPPYGIIHYEDRDFAVDYTTELENALLDILAEMRRDERRHQVPRSHDISARCAKCGFRQLCDQKI
jgi:CRISPR-associated exonuclease Cas4